MATSQKQYIGAPEPFHAKTDDWLLYCQRFEHFLLANGITEADPKKHLFLAMMGGATFKLLANLVAPRSPGEESYEDIHKVLKQHYKPKPIKIAERFRFYKRSQFQTETVAEYLAELRRLAVTCEFGNFLNDALCDRFVCGLNNSAMQRRLLSEPNLDLSRACELAQGMEAARKDAKEMQILPTGVNEESSANRVGTGSSKPCSRCLGVGHIPSECRFKSAKCNKCLRTGHIAKACRSKAPVTTRRTQQRRYNKRDSPEIRNSKGKRVDRIDKESLHQDAESSDVESPADIIHVHLVSPTVPESYKVPVELNGQHLIMELDTGAAVSLVSEKTWSTQLNSPALKATSLKLQSYPDKKLQVLGYCTIQAKVQNMRVADLPLVVVQGQGPSLFGRNWLQEVKLNWTDLARVHNIHTTTKTDQLTSLLQKYEDVVNDKLGHCKNVKAKLHLKSDVTPKFCRARPLALALKPKVEAELERQEKRGVLRKVDVSEWATPIVPVVKPNGSIRLCGDYKVSLNPQLQVNQYPLPHLDELFAAMNGGQKFTTLDLSEAYLQIELEEEAKSCTTINTHKGLYAFNRLPYGIASSPAIFQCVMEQILPKVPGIVCYIDDILITGKDDEEHLHRLDLVLKSFKENGLTIKMSKCHFLQPSVQYLGKIISQEGIQPAKSKIEAILKVKPPCDITQLRSFLGMVNHYSKFIRCLADLSVPLNNLLKKDVAWEWTETHQSCFDKLKEALTTTTVLAHFDPKMPIGLACDASAVGIGAVIYHKYPDGSERPIAYASKTLSDSERNYSQIEREALSIVFGIKKFHQHLYGHKFSLLTDHKPLLAIFSPRKGIPAMAASRLQRWAILLSAYTYDIEYKPTKEHGNADMLSRLPVGPDQFFDDKQSLNIVVNLIQDSQVQDSPVSATEVQKATRADPVLQKLLWYIKKGWPQNKKKIDKQLHPYFQIRTELTIHKDCILRGLRIIIPEKLRKQVLTEIHSSHLGIVRMKSIARLHVWWPRIDSDIEACSKECRPCQENHRNPNRAPLTHGNRLSNHGKDFI